MATSYYEFDGHKDAYAGPLVILTGQHAFSAAENFMLTMERRPDLTFIGDTSAGTNGNITTTALPGSWGLSFTGMQILHADGSRFHGIGIVPDIEVLLDPKLLAEGRDPVLEAGIEHLRGGR